MRNKSEENKKLPELVTLILKKERFKVLKKNLVSKSQYFAILLSENYVEHGQTELMINYDIPPVSLQDFIVWIHHDNFFIKNYDTEEFDRLLILLELGVLFAADNLIQDVTDKLEKHYMSPKYVINIWLLTEELSNNVLRDLSLAICLDRFCELPLRSICEISRINFLKLIGNVNVRSSESYLLYVTREWIKYHPHDFTISYILKNKDILKNKKTNILHSIISCESSDVVNSEQFIHCWDGNDFFELTSFKYPKDIIDRSTGKHILTGMQITGKEYNLYLCGGEFGIGSGKFNKNVWRYSLISKKWYLETVMPYERRNMITVFLKNKLILMGGVGRYRQKLRTVDIYDIHTGFWTSGSDIPLDFTSVPEHYIIDEKLILCDYQIITENRFAEIRYIVTSVADRGSLYRPRSKLKVWIYFPDKDKWIIRKGFNYDCTFSLLPDDIPILMLKTLPCYIDINNPDEMILRVVTETCNQKDCIHGIQDFKSVFKHIEFGENDSLLTNCDAHFSILKPYYEFGGRRSPYIIVGVDSETFTRLDSEDTYASIHFHSIPIRDLNKFRSFLFSHSPKRFFNLIHPAHLHTTNFY